MKLAVCIPSRGLIHSRTIDHVLDNLEKYDDTYKIFITHNLPIPDCFNNLTERAIEWGADYLWFVEEDMKFDIVLPDLLKHDVATIDYPIKENSKALRFYPNVVGTGCTLVKASLFEKIGKWRSDIVYDLKDWTPSQLKNYKHLYGLHDVHFAQQCKKHGIKVEIVGEGNQYRVKKMGKEGTNIGFHDVDTIT